jgi:hypothetical protein
MNSMERLLMVIRSTHPWPRRARRFSRKATISSGVRPCSHALARWSYFRIEQGRPPGSRYGFESLYGGSDPLPGRAIWFRCHGFAGDLPASHARCRGRRAHPPARCFPRAARNPPSPPHEHRRSLLPWFIGLVALIGLTIGALTYLKVIDPMSLLRPAGGSGAAVAAQVTLAGVETEAPSPTSPPAPTDTATPAAPTQAATEAAVVPPALVATDTPTIPPTPTESPTPAATDTPAATPLGGGSGQIAFASNRGGNLQIWSMGVDGSNPLQLTDRPDGSCQPPGVPMGCSHLCISVQRE